MVRLARRKLQTSARRGADEEDVALSAFASFCRRADEGRLPRVCDRNDLWRLLVTLTIRMAIDLVRREGRQKRGGPAAARAALNAVSPLADREAKADELASRQPMPEFVAEVAEECERLLGGLDDSELKAIALWKTQGYTNDEIAAKLGCVLRTVERKLQTIRRRWSGDDTAPHSSLAPDG